MEHKYGEFTSSQIKETKKSLRSNIFFLLLCVDPETASEFQNVNVKQCFEDTLYKISGCNELLLCQKEIVLSMSLLESALMEYNSPDFDFKKYRKLILDAGAEISRLKEE